MKLKFKKIIKYNEYNILASFIDHQIETELDVKMQINLRIFYNEWENESFRGKFLKHLNKTNLNASLCFFKKKFFFRSWLIELVDHVSEMHIKNATSYQFFLEHVSALVSHYIPNNASFISGEQKTTGKNKQKVETSFEIKNVREIVVALPSGFFPQ